MIWRRNKLQPHPTNSKQKNKKEAECKQGMDHLLSIFGPKGSHYRQDQKDNSNEQNEHSEHNEHNEQNATSNKEKSNTRMRNKDSGHNRGTVVFSSIEQEERHLCLSWEKSIRAESGRFARCPTELWTRRVEKRKGKKKLNASQLTKSTFLFLYFPRRPSPLPLPMGSNALDWIHTFFFFFLCFCVCVRAWFVQRPFSVGDWTRTGTATTTNPDCIGLPLNRTPCSTQPSHIHIQH